MNKEIANFFWHGDLPLLQKAAINSFVKNNFEVNIWSFSNISLPGCKSKNASDIIPEKDLHKYQQLSPDGVTYDTLSLFSDLFRVSVLERGSGWWFDCDCFCLVDESKFKILRNSLGDNTFIGGYHKLTSSSRIAGSSTLYLDPIVATLIRKEMEYLLNLNNNVLNEWGKLGPDMIENFVNEHNKTTQCLDEFYFYPIHWSETELLTKSNSLKKSQRKIKNSFILHIWNSSVKMANKNTIEKNSLLDTLIKINTPKI